ncbi:MAG: hypothetical protein ACRDG9_12180 [Actinomycetota bacterium]
MARAEEWISEGAASYLEPGEEILAALVAQPRGHTQAVAGVKALGRSQEGENVAAGEQAGMHLEAPMALALTPKRLIALSISNPVGMGVSGKVKGILSEVPVADVDSIEVKRLLVGSRITLTVRGVPMKLEAGAGAKAKPMAEALAGR